MTPGELDCIRDTIEAVTVRAIDAERRAAKAEIERDQLRALLTRLRTSLSESFNDPGGSA